MRRTLSVIIISLSIFNCTPALSVMNQSETVLLASDLQRLTNVFSVIKKHYYKSIDDSSLVARAISGVLASLDPHSSYLNEQAYKDLEIMTWGKLVGIGVEVVSDQGLLKVISPIDDTPAYRAGVKPGDYIVQINNKLVRDMTATDAVNMMRGKIGGLVSLTIIRKSENKPLIFNLRRKVIKLKVVKERMLEPEYGYVRVAVFQDQTEKDMVQAIKRLQKQALSKNLLRRGSLKTSLKGLILDLRNNPGGLVDSAIQTADDFLDADTLKDNNLIVYARGQDDEELISAKATSGDLLPGVPIVILINEGSASAAEIVAGALQDHKRAIIVGTRSFGKGSMQTVIPIDRTSAVKLTTALYYTPLGRSIQAKGIEPDINVENIQLPQGNGEKQNIPRIDESSLIDHIQNGDGTNSKSYQQSVEKQQEQSEEERKLAYKDYQLYEALHILKSQNVTRH